MAAGIELYNDVLNQKGSPALYSDTFANRPAFGYTGRLFISTDTNEIYRDTGTAWVLIGSGGGGVNIYNSNGSLTAARTVTMAGFPLTFSGGASAVNLNINANAGVDRDIQFQTAGVNRFEFLVTGAESGSNAGADFSLRAYNDAGTFIFSPFTVRRRTGEIETFAEENITTGGQSIIGVYTNSTGTYANGLTTTGGNPQSSNFNIYTLASAGNVTFANSNLVGTTVNVIRAQVQNAGTVTFPASGTSALRAATNFVSQLQYNTSAAAGTFTHMANIHLQGIYEVSGGNVFTITNAYQLLLNSLNENGYTGAQLALTNRWGIYQDGASDLNYFAANTLLGTTTNTGERLQVAGTSRFTGTTTTIGDIQQSGANIIRNINSTLFLQTDGAGQPIVFRTAGAAERMRITSAGDVGIGTSAPVTYAAGAGVVTQIHSGSTSLAELRITNITTGAGTIIGFTLQQSGVQAAVWNGSNGAMVFGTSNSERVRITSGGNVLIGTTTDAGQLLQVTGNARITGTLEQNNTVNFSAATRGTITWGSAPNATNEIHFRGGTNQWIGLLNSSLHGIYVTNTNGNILIGNLYTDSVGGVRTIVHNNGTAPTGNVADSYQLYSADITAGNAAAHFRTEGGAIIKVYQETTAVGSATFASPGSGNTVKTDDTFDGYTLQQVVKALRNQGLLA